MAMSVVYATVNGVLVEEDRGGVVTCYVSDTLGSVAKTTESTGAVTSETTYWPFGETRTSSGANPSPWGFVGVLGYYMDTAARLYVRARLLRTDLSRRLSVDPFWPAEHLYQYCSESPIRCTDRSGTATYQECVKAAIITAIAGCIAAASTRGATPLIFLPS
jgi:RHS repeat-associated protein